MLWDTEKYWEREALSKVFSSPLQFKDAQNLEMEVVKSFNPSRAAAAGGTASVCSYMF